MVAGQNAAYDQFPCQYQIFYHGKARQSLWYDPVFQVRPPSCLPMAQQDKLCCQRTNSVPNSNADTGQVDHGA